jgi:hypothetical protein
VAFASKDCRPTHANERCIELKALSDTRWSAQIFACHAVRSRFGVLVELLQLIADESNGDRSLDARSLLKMIDLKFVFLCRNVLHTACPNEISLRQFTKFTAERRCCV